MLSPRPLFRSALLPAAFLLTLVLGIAPAQAGSKKKKLTTTVRIHNEANPMDGEQFTAPVRIPYPPYNIHISKIPLVSELDISGFRSYPQPDGSYGAMLYLTDRGRIALETVSLEKQRTYLVVMVNGRQLDPVFIDRPSREKTFYIKSGLSVRDLELFSKNFKMANASEELSRIATARGEAEEGKRRATEGKAERKKRKKGEEAPAASSPADDGLFLEGPVSDSRPVDPVP